MIKDRSACGETISFGKEYVRSDSFLKVYNEGMALVEETADYLGGRGRTEAKELQPAAAFAYATESMRLTTRLMQMASWLLICRAVKDGEMTPEEADIEEQKVKLRTVGHLSRADNFDDLPVRLKGLVYDSLRFYERLLKIETASRTEAASVRQDKQSMRDIHIQRIEKAFSGTTGRAVVSPESVQSSGHLHKKTATE
jgi:regulator of CtrA degradation